MNLPTTSLSISASPQSVSSTSVSIGPSVALAVSQTAQGLRLAVVDQGSSGTHAAGPADALTPTHVMFKSPKEMAAFDIPPEEIKTPKVDFGTSK